MEELTIKEEEITIEEHILGIKEEKDILLEDAYREFQVKHEQENDQELTIEKFEFLEDSIYDTCSTTDPNEDVADSHEIMPPIHPKTIVALLEDLPSDLETDTDEDGEDDDYLYPEDPLTKAMDDTLTDQDQLPGDIFARRCIIAVNGEKVTTGNSKNLPVEEKSSMPIVEMNRKWKKKEEASVVTEFSMHEGPVAPHFSDCKDAADYFLKFIDDEIISHICQQSNLYATQKLKTLDVSQPELLVFLGINLFMGYVRLPSYRHYWSTAIDMRCELVSNHMTIDRFRAILSYLHLNDNSEIYQHREEKLYKIEPLVSKLKQNFKTLYFPKRELCVDESMILFKGRSTVKQYNPMKPIKRGYKVLCLGDSTGFIVNFEIYSGKKLNIENSESVVLDLAKEYFDEGYFLYFDNYFSSFSLLEELKLKKVYACCTIPNTSKGFPEMASDESLQRGQFDYRSTSQGITTYKWKDIKSVYLVSNFHGIDQTTVKRTLKDRTMTLVPCPKVVYDYNHYMGGIDKHEMLRGSNGIDRISKKWWHRLFFGLLDMAIVNAYVVYCQIKEQVSMLEFRRMVCRGLVTKGGVIKRTNKRRRVEFSVPREIRLSSLGLHWPVYTKSRRRCEVCSREKLSSRPLSKCITCKTHLCINSSKNCFAKYHEINNFN